MTTIGTAVLQIIPSLKGVSEAIDKQIDGKVVEVKVEPKVDQTAAKKAGKDAGDAIAKEAKDAVSKGEIGKAVADEVKTSVKKSNAGAEVAKSLTEDVKKASPGREIAKVIVDGLADGVKQGLPVGSVGTVIVDEIASGVKQGIDNNGLGTQVVGSITKAIKSGNLAGSIKDAVLPGITQIGTNIRTAATEWSGGIADALRSGDIQGATADITRAVEGSTNIISSLGEAFGLKTDSFKSGSEKAVGYIGDIGGSLQDVINRGGDVSTKISDAVGQFGQLSGAAATLAGKDFGKGTKFGDSLAAVSAAAGPIGLTLAAADGIDKVLSGLNIAKFAEVPGSALWFLHQLNSDWSGIKELKSTLDGLAGPLGLAARNSAQSALDAARQNAANAANSAPVQRGNAVPGDTYRGPGRAGGGRITGPGGPTSDVIPIWASNGEYVVKAAAARKNMPLLEAINFGKVPGFAGGGLVAGDQQLRQVIMDRFGISDIGGYRPADKYGEHSTGRALDVMVGNDRSKGDAVKDFALANASAIDLKWAIWRQHLYYPGGGGYDMPDRGSPTQNHMDHVHIFSGTGITNGLRGALAGAGPKGGIAAGVGVPGAAAVGGPGAEDTSSSDQTGAPSSSGGIGPMPSSISGLAGWGLDNLGAGVGTTGTGSDLSLFGKAAGSAVSGQVSSALGVLGIPDAPPILQAASQLLGGIKVGGKGLFDFGSPGGGAGPISAKPLSGAPAGIVGDPTQNLQGRTLGPESRGGATYNLTVGTLPEAVMAMQQKEREAAAARLQRF
jgi:hypothetical protein